MTVAEDTHTERPLITFAVFAYNQEQYIREAIEGAFAQTYEPLEIILSDDSSSDKTFEIIHEMTSRYTGRHKVVVNRNSENLGLIGHVNKIFEIASAEIVVVAGGDDISLPHRTEEIATCFSNNPDAMAVHSDVQRLSAEGEDVGVWVPPVQERKMDLEDMAVSGAMHIGASAAYRKALYKKFGPICERHAFEDLVLGFRAALWGQLLYIEGPLVKYRTGVGISSVRKLRDRRSRIAQRVGDINRKVGVLRQRLWDYETCNPCVDNGEIGRKLNSNLLGWEMRLMYYKCPKRLLDYVLTARLIYLLRVMKTETGYMLGLFR